MQKIVSDRFLQLKKKTQEKGPFCPFNVIVEELLGEYNFNTEDPETARVELWKEKFETKVSKPLASQLHLDISFVFILFMVFFVDITSL